MIVMPSNATGWFWHCLSRETGKIGHLYSPGGYLRRPIPWFRYALDNGAFACWNQKENTFNDSAWDAVEKEWEKMLRHFSTATQRPLWAIVPDVPGNAEATIERFRKYVRLLQELGIPIAFAVQDGMTLHSLKELPVQPEVVCVGGTDVFKWGSVRMWAKHFPRVHVLRCNSPEKLYLLEELGVESCDGTGWNRGDKTQTMGLEEWARRNPQPITEMLTPYTCRQARPRQQEWAF